MSRKKKSVKVNPHFNEKVEGVNGLRVGGVDPGIHGGVALVHGAELRNVAPMPIRYERKSDGEYRTLIDEWSFCDFLIQWRPDVLFAEDVYAMQDQGVVSMFSFGVGKGVIMGVCAGLGIDLRWVSPQRWKGQLSIMPPRTPGHTDKEHKERLKALSIHKACTLFPTRADALQKDGPAEAALIAAYGTIALARRADQSREES